MEKLKHIKLGQKSLPIKCDNYVLMEIQENYGTITQFEAELVGLKPLMDKEGNPAVNADGKQLFTAVEPSIKAINFVLPLMINEGLEIEADSRNKPFEPLTEKEIIRAIDIPYKELSIILHEEFARCFKTKK